MGPIDAIWAVLLSASAILQALFWWLAVRLFWKLQTCRRRIADIEARLDATLKQRGLST